MRIFRRTCHNSFWWKMSYFVIWTLHTQTTQSTKLLPSEIEANLELTQPPHLWDLQPPLFRVNPRATVIPGCQNDLCEGDPPSRLLWTQRTLVGAVGTEDHLPISTHSMPWDIRDGAGQFLPSMLWSVSLLKAISVGLFVFQLFSGFWKITEGESILKSMHLQRVEGTLCQSRGCSHTGGSESLRSGSCVTE